MRSLAGSPNSYRLRIPMISAASPITAMTPSKTPIGTGGWATGDSGAGAGVAVGCAGSTVAAVVGRGESCSWGAATGESCSDGPARAALPAVRVQPIIRAATASAVRISASHCLDLLGRLGRSVSFTVQPSECGDTLVDSAVIAEGAACAKASDDFGGHVINATGAANVPSGRTAAGPAAELSRPPPGPMRQLARGNGR